MLIAAAAFSISVAAPLYAASQSGEDDSLFNEDYPKDCHKFFEKNPSWKPTGKHKFKTVKACLDSYGAWLENDEPKSVGWPVMHAKICGCKLYKSL
jgi:hypothetical protein